MYFYSAIGNVATVDVSDIVVGASRVTAGRGLIYSSIETLAVSLWDAREGVVADQRCLVLDVRERKKGSRYSSRVMCFVLDVRHSISPSMYVNA